RLGAPVAVVAWRDDVVAVATLQTVLAEVLIEHDQLAGIAEGQRLQQDSAHHGEERSGCAQTEGHDKNRDTSKARRTEESASPVLQIAPELVETVQVPGSAGLLSRQLRTAKAAQRCFARLARTHACGEVLGDLLLQVEAELLVEAVFCLPSSEEHL